MSSVNNPVIIDDFPYDPKIRPSFFDGPIGQIIAESVLKSSEILKIINLLNYYRPQLEKITVQQVNDYDPFWDNKWLTVLDGAMLYVMAASHKPNLIIEVGSGNSTKFIHRSLTDNNINSKLISIDPLPRANIDKLCHKVIRSSLEEADLSIFRELTKDDMVIIDSSHRCFPNSDVTVFFTEILPELPAGLIYTMHDIGLPDEIFVNRYYNEQYLLATWLLAGAGGDEIIFPEYYLGHHTSLLNSFRDNFPVKFGGGGFFWMKRGDKR